MKEINVPTPAEVAAQNRLSRETLVKQEFANRCVEVVLSYTGASCVTVEVKDEWEPFVAEVTALLSGWYSFLAEDGTLYLGDRQQVELLRETFQVFTKSTAPVTPAVEQATPFVEYGTGISTFVEAPTAKPRQFAVCARQPETKALPTQTPKQAFERLLLGPLEACGTGSKPLVRALGFHGLIETVHIAFANHYGLELSPDDIWVTIAQGLARIVAQDPENYRAKLVEFEGQTQIRISRDSFVLGSADNDWMGCFDEFSRQIAEHVGEKNHALLISNFTTTGVIEKAASNVVLMDTVRSYFKYRVDTLCGIPFVKLHGTVEDWQSVADKVSRLADYGDLGWWLSDLQKILSQIVASAKGEPNSDFWNSIYKCRSESGGISMTGWLLKLLPFINYRDGSSPRNPLLGHADARPHVPGRIDLVYRDIPDMKGEKIINSSVLPASLSTVPFEWNYFGTPHQYQFVAGIIGYTQNGGDGALKPQMGWAVRPEPKVCAAAPNA